MEASEKGAAALARAVIQAMEERAIEPVPANYRVWYAHLADENPQLSRAILEIEQGSGFTPKRSAELYERFFGIERESEVLEATCRKLESTLEALMGDIDGAADGTTRYGRALASLRKGVSRRPDAATLEAITGRILQVASHMQKEARRFEEQLHRSGAEVGALRRSLEEALRLTLADPLTDLANRKRLERQLQVEVAAAQASGDALSLLMADIDHFKAFNDSHGHPFGDQVLKLVARTMVRCLEGRHLVARYGGEEFAVMLPGTPLKDAVARADGIRRAVRSHRIVGRASGRELGSVTLSIGAAALCPGESPAMLLARADRALYEAKRGGRDRVVAADGTPVEPGAVEPGAVELVGDHAATAGQ